MWGVNFGAFVHCYNQCVAEAQVVVTLLTRSKGKMVNDQVEGEGKVIRSSTFIMLRK
jgi:hypothetical protein